MAEDKFIFTGWQLERSSKRSNVHALTAKEHLGPGFCEQFHLTRALTLINLLRGVAGSYPGNGECDERYHA
jgi:hypothetical protein